MPTYAETCSFINNSSVPGMMSWIIPRHWSSFTKFFIISWLFYYNDFTLAIISFAKLSSPQFTKRLFT